MVFAELRMHELLFVIDAAISAFSAVTAERRMSEELAMLSCDLFVLCEIGFAHSTKLAHWRVTETFHVFRRG